MNAPTKFGCGCTFHPELDINGISPWLEPCPLHRAAPRVAREHAEMRALLARVVCGSRALTMEGRHACAYAFDNWSREDLCHEARALLARIDAETT